MLPRSEGPPRGRVGAGILKPRLVALMRFVDLVGVVAVACIHAGAWTLSRDVIGAPSFRGQLTSVSYTPFDGCTYDPDPNPDKPKRCTPEQIKADLQAIAPYTRTIRTYSSTKGMELVPEIARDVGLRVSIGAWLEADSKDADPAKEKAEFR